MPIATINPATGEMVKEYSPLGEPQIEEKLALAHAAFERWRTTPFPERAVRLVRAAELLESERDRFARTMVVEMGKPIRAARDEVLKCAWVCRHYAEQAEAFLTAETVSIDGARCQVRYQPLGPILAIMPWNFPFWQVFRFAAPALMAGNVGLLKHASNVPQSALEIEEVFRRAGLPDGAFQALLVGTPQIPRIIDDPRVRAVTLTGSETAGSQVAAQAGRGIKKTVIELGGSDPFIVMPSADLHEAVATAVRARTINNGQSCIAAKRFIVHEAVAGEFNRRFVAGMEALVVGDPMSDSTDVGPLATAALLDTLDDQVARSVRAGARVLTGGRRLGGPGFYYPPTALTDVRPGSPAYADELFGPVGVLFSVADLDEAIRLANDTPFGLGSSAWTNDSAEQERFIDELEAGMVFINGMVVSDPRLPFGGVKHSGYGRELGAQGIREFVNVKTVRVAAPSPAASR